MSTPGAPVLRGGSRLAGSAILVLHGGQEHSTLPTSRRQLSYLRMTDMYVGLRRLSRDCAVYSLRYAVRGWNGGGSGSIAPVNDACWALDQITATHPGVHVTLLGHSMGARVAFAIAGHPQVTGVCALAPWLPEAEPLPAALSHRRFVLAHGTADRTTSPVLSASYAQRLRLAGALVARYEQADGGHALLDQPRLWHRFAVRTTLGLASDRPLPDGVRRALASDCERSLALPLAGFAQQPQ